MFLCSNMIGGIHDASLSYTVLSIDRTCINFEIINRDQPPFFSVSLRLLYSRPVRFAAPSRTANLRQPTIIRETEKRQSSLRDCTVFSRYAKLLSHIERILSNLAIHRLTCHSYCTPTLPTNFSHGVEHSETEPRCLYIERIDLESAHLLCRFITAAVQWRRLGQIRC